MELQRIFRYLSSIITAFLILTTRGHGKIQTENFKNELLKGKFEVFKTKSSIRVSCVMCSITCLMYKPKCVAYTCDLGSKKCDFYAKGSTDLHPAGVKAYVLETRSIPVVFQPFTVRGKKYHVYRSSDKKNYFDARSFCKEHGGYLFDIDSSVKYDVARTVFKGLARDRYYVGANDIASEGTFVLDRTNTMIDIRMWRWASRQPISYSGKEDCASMTSDDVENWAEECDVVRRFLCEK